MDWLQLAGALLPLLTPVVVMFAKKLPVLLPKRLIPIFVPIIGAGLEILGSGAVGSPSNPLLGAMLGAVGLWGREAYDQLRKAKSDGTVLG